MDRCSIWNRKDVRFPELKGDIERDIVIIGGGIAGFLSAYKLAEAGACVTLIEADRLFCGTTGNTTAKITCNQGNIYYELERRYGKGFAALYYSAQTSAMRGYKELIQKYSIDCGFDEIDSFIYSRTSRKKLEKTCKILNGFGAECEITNRTAPVKAVCALKMGGQYVFDPLRFLYALPINFEIYENTRAIDIDATTKVISTEKGRIKAKTVIVATHFPIINAHGAYWLKLRQSTSYTVAVSGIQLNGMHLDERDDGLSLRPFDGGITLGGFDHRTGRTKDAKIFERLKTRAEELFGSADVICRWNAEDVMTFDGVPMAGKYAKKTDGVYVITGFNKWGMTNAMACADVLRDLILERENPYADLYSPQRHIKKSTGAFFANAAVNGAHIALGYLRTTIKTATDLPKGHGGIVWYKGKRRAVYRDEDGKIYAIGRMCPHMHCELKWNANTRTWDCPCHGSRFDKEGNIISEPATKSAKCDLERS